MSVDSASALRSFEPMETFVAPRESRAGATVTGAQLNDELRLCPVRLAWGILLVGLICGIVCPLVMPYDQRLSKYFSLNPIPGDIRKAIEFFEVLAHGVGVAVLLLTIGVVAKRGWRCVLGVGTLAYGGGALADLAKLTVFRPRPADDWQRVDIPFAITSPLQEILEFDAARHSFPSGHTATVVGLMLGLMLFFPKGRWLFVIYGMIAIFQRIVATAHYPSDVLAGVTVAGCWCFVCLHPRCLGRRFARHLAKWQYDGGKAKPTALESGASTS